MGPPPPAPRQGRLSCSSTATHSGSTDSRTGIPKGSHRKENQFIYRNGSKLHAYDRDKAPYPSSFDPKVVELQCLDNALMSASKGSLSFADFTSPQSVPKRCLDIGTGLGLWVISCAKAWPEATFVGLDMVNIQVPLRILDADVADRIEWVHTNVLRNKLPFEDDEFDYVHILGLALGIPENKLVQEILRVMKPGAIIEQVEEDALFPILPKWYTAPLRAHSRTLSTAVPGTVQQRLSFPHMPDTSHLEHEHEMLESLFGDVWTNRFINRKPTSALPGYFSAFFERVVAPPVSIWLSPPFPPSHHSPASTNTILPHSHGNGSAEVHGDTSDLLSPHVDNTDSLAPSPSTTLRTSSENSIKGKISPSPSMTSLREIARRIDQTRTDPENASTISLASYTDSQHSSGSGSKSSKSGKRPSVMLLASPEDSTSLGGNFASDIVPVERVQSQDEHTQYMHLFRTFTYVLSIKEAMWDELLVRVHAKDERLRRYGWRDEDYNEQTSRAIFDYAVELYESDMRGRIALWNSAVQNGWDLPSRDPPSKAEVMEQMHLRREIMEAQRLAELNDEPEQPARVFRILIGHKES
ncbi:hypothetical protein C8Q80DRAFT_1215626 [Daedaleopsis nitida]|nr:hypothetical protein C8Q80DRAFT_1215626 [Daedaleopsis nitida]